MKTKIIGLTGGIGSGKTTVAHYFSELGIPTYIADIEARTIFNNSEIQKLILQELGSEILEGNEINRKKVAAIVFNDPEKLKKLNHIIHPAVEKDFEKWVLQHQSHPFVVKESAILLETIRENDYFIVITVVAPLELKIKRVMERDHISKEEVLLRMKNQWTDEQRISKSDYVIHNQSISETKKQVDTILNLLNYC